MRMNAMQTQSTQQWREQAASSGYRATGRSPIGIGGAMAVHALVIGAWLLIPREAIDTMFDPPPLNTVNIPLPPPPDPVEPTSDQPVRTRPTRQSPATADPLVRLPRGDMVIAGKTDPGTDIDPGPTIILPPADPPRSPVLVGATIDPRALAAFQPDYPGAMVRLGMEGTVKVRVTINAEGRVTAIEKISASDQAFWLATERHALRRWRFRPATRDGVAIASAREMTIRFTLTER